MVIDLKTGKSTAVTGAELAEHPQLGAYQAAVEAGAFAEFGDESGGAALVQLGTSAKDAREQNQPARRRGAGGRLGDRAGPADRRYDGSRHVRRGGQLEVPGLPGADQLPGLRAGAPGGRAADRPTSGDPMTQPTLFGAGPAPTPRLADSGPRYTPVELAKLLRLPAPTREQAAIIAAPVEPLLVVAGAGSGKTETMAARVVWLVANSYVRPEQILGLTFTRKAAGELAHRVRTRLDQLIRRVGRQGRDPLDDPLAGEPTVSTYHSYAGRIVTEHGLRAGYEPSTRLLTEASRWQLVDLLVRNYDGDMSEVDRMPSTITDAVLALAGELDEHLVAPDDAGGLDRPVLRRGAGPGRAGCTPTCARRSPSSRPGCACCRWCGRTPGARRTSRRWTSPTSSPGRPGWPGTTRGSA